MTKFNADCYIYYSLQLLAQGWPYIKEVLTLHPSASSHGQLARLQKALVRLAIQAHQSKRTQNPLWDLGSEGPARWLHSCLRLLQVLQWVTELYVRAYTCKSLITIHGQLFLNLYINYVHIQYGFQGCMQVHCTCTCTVYSCTLHRWVQVAMDIYMEVNELRAALVT